MGVIVGARYGLSEVKAYCEWTRAEVGALNA